MTVRKTHFSSLIDIVNHSLTMEIGFSDEQLIDLISFCDNEGDIVVVIVMMRIGL